MSNGYYYSEIPQINYQVTQKRDFTSYTALQDVTIAKEDAGSIWTFKQPSEWQERWFLSSNAKDIGTLYFR